MASGILISFSVCAQQDYFWVGGSGNWSDVSHWATTSGGTTFHTAVPTQDDNVYFDAGSFNASGQSVTLDVDAYCKTMDWSGAANFPAFNASGTDLNIYGSVTLNTDVSYNLYNVYLSASDAGNTITSSGKTFGVDSRVWFSGQGTYALNDPVTAKNIYLTKGTFISNNQSITCTGNFELANLITDSLDADFGSSTISCDHFLNSAHSNLTLNAGTSTVICNLFKGDISGEGPFQYYNLVIDDEGVIYGSNVFNALIVEEGGSLQVESGTTQTLQDLQIDGNKFALIELTSSLAGSEATLSAGSGTLDVSYVTLQDIHASGGATFNAANAVDAGNTTGWNITPPVGKSYYWIGDGGNWSDPGHWATTSGGSILHRDYPGQFDDVFFDENSFSQEAQTVTIDLGTATCHHIDWTGVTNMPELYGTYAYNLHIYGSAYFNDNMELNLHKVRMSGTETGLELVLGQNGKISYPEFYCKGEYLVLTDFTCSGLTIFEGTVDFGASTIDVAYDFTVSTLGETDLSLGSSAISCRDFDLSVIKPLTLDPGTAVIQVTRDFNGRGNSFNKVVMNGTGELLGSNTFDTLVVTPGSSVSFEKSATQTVGELILTGTKSSPISLGSTEDSVRATLSVSAGTVDGLYLILQDIEGAGGAVFNAGQTIDNGNNTGWSITGITGQDYYWVGGPGNWSDYSNHWAVTSGGSVFHTGEPGPLDNVYFDEHSFVSDEDAVTLDLEEISVHDLDLSGLTYKGALLGDIVLNIYGSLYISPLAEFFPEDLHFHSGEDEEISVNSDYLGGATFNMEGQGSWTLTDTLSINTLNLLAGTFNTAGAYVDINFTTELKESNGVVLRLDTSVFYTRSLSAAAADNFTIDAQQGTFIFSSSFRPDFTGSNNVTLNDVVVRNTNLHDEGTLHGNMSLNKLIIEPGTTVEIESGKTITVNQLIAQGTADDVITIRSTEAGNPGTISQASDTVHGDFLELQDNIAIGGAVFLAYSSISLGNVSGWTFNKASQTIDFPEIGDRRVNDEPFSLVATASSGLAVGFEVISGPATIEGSTLTLSGTAGEVKIKASQPGDITYNPAPSVINSFMVTKYGQEILFDSLDTFTYGDDTVYLNISSSLGLPVSLSVEDESVVVVSEGWLVPAGVGETVIYAIQVGNDSVESAEAEIPVVVNKAVLTVTADDKVITYGERLPDFTYTISGLVLEDSENALDLKPILSTTAADTSNAGQYSITIQGGSDANYDFVYESGTLTIAKAPAVITLDDLEQEADGSPRHPAVSTDPEGLNYLVTYNGSVEVPSEAGEYEVVVTIDESNYEGTETATFILAERPALLGTMPEAEVKVYPNPAVNNVMIACSEALKVAICGPEGSILKSALPNERLDISALKVGVYLVLITDAHGRVIVSRKLIKR